MKYIIIPLVKLIVVAFAYAVAVPLIIAGLLLYLCWTFDVSGTKDIIFGSDGFLVHPFHEPDGRSYYYKTGFDYIINNKTYYES